MTNGVFSTLDLVLIPNTSSIVTSGKQYVDRRLLPGLLEAAAEFRQQAGRPLFVAEAFRDLATQDRYWRERYYEAPTGQLYAGKRWRKRTGAAVAAVPGTSNHGYGIALDLWSGIDASFRSREHLIWDGVARRRGWIPDVSSEAWHWRGTPGLVPAGDTLTPYPSEEDDMTDDERQMLRDIHNAIFAGGPGMPDAKRSLGGSMLAINENIDQLRKDLEGARKGLGVLLHRLVNDVPDDGDVASIPRLSRAIGTRLTGIAEQLKVKR